MEVSPVGWNSPWRSSCGRRNEQLRLCKSFICFLVSVLFLFSFLFLYFILLWSLWDNATRRLGGSRRRQFGWRGQVCWWVNRYRRGGGIYKVVVTIVGSRIIIRFELLNFNRWSRRWRRNRRPDRTLIMFIRNRPRFVIEDFAIIVLYERKERKGRTESTYSYNLLFKILKINK